MKRISFKLLLLTALFFCLNGLARAQVRIAPEHVKALKGTWVKTSVERDTIVFKMQKGLEHHFYLKPERSTNPPRPPQGAYTFTIDDDSFTAQWLYSSAAPVHPPKYYFKLDTRNNILIVGNFYNAPGEGRYLRFQKIEPPKKKPALPEN